MSAHRTLMVKPPTYDAICNQKTPRKNSRNESNISMKKYHQSPTFGVKSGSSIWTPYVDERNSHEYPVIKNETINKVPIAIRRIEI